MPSNLECLQFAAKAIQRAAVVLVCLFQPGASDAQHGRLGGSDLRELPVTQGAFTLFLGVGERADGAQGSAVILGDSKALDVRVAEGVVGQASEAYEKVNFAKLKEAWAIAHAGVLADSKLGGEGEE